MVAYLLQFSYENDYSTFLSGQAGFMWCLHQTRAGRDGLERDCALEFALQESRGLLALCHGQSEADADPYVRISALRLVALLARNSSRRAQHTLTEPIPAILKSMEDDPTVDFEEIMVAVWHMSACRLFLEEAARKNWVECLATLARHRRDAELGFLLEQLQLWAGDQSNV
ncbi:unnamed protein product [Symbiodinium sp. CCMP2592]|nr:unnamed protein product [Symbiodinium sp. CCMP2592]